MTQLSDVRPRRTPRGVLTAAQQKHFRERLQRNLDDERAIITHLYAEMASFLETRRDMPTDDEHDPEGPTLAFERAQANAILQQVRQRAIETSQALDRLESGSYGSCQSCGATIAVGRLEARPSTPHCIGCAA